MPIIRGTHRNDALWNVAERVARHLMVPEKPPVPHTSRRVNLITVNEAWRSATLVVYEDLEGHLRTLGYSSRTCRAVGGGLPQDGAVLVRFNIPLAEKTSLCVYVSK